MPNLLNFSGFINIPAFLEKAEWVITCGMGDHGRECLECGGEEPNHKTSCQLRTTLAALESGSLIIREVQNGDV